MEDYAAMQRLKRGDLSGLKPLVERYELNALRAAFLTTQDRALAEDAVQTAFLRVVDHADQYDPVRPFEPWFMRIVLNESLKSINRLKRFVQPDEETASDTQPIERLPDPDADPEATAESHESEEAVQAALEALSPEHRAVIVMRFYLGYSETEIAEQTGAPLGTVRSRMFHAQKRLRGLLSTLMTPNED